MTATSPETLVNKLNRGMTSAVVGVDKGYARIIKHFDIFSRADAILPYRSYENGDTDSDTNKIARYEFANGKLYGLSTASGSGQKLFSRELLDLSDSTWDTPSGVSVSGVPDGLMFIDYPTTGKLYWSLLSGAIASYEYATATYAASARAIRATAQALRHSKDDILYIPCANVLARNNNGSWTDAALTFPPEYTISSLFEHGNYLGIALKPVNGFGRSKVALWDRDSSLVTLSETIDWDVGSLECVESIDGVLIGISTLPQSFNGRLIFKTWTGGASANEPFLELRSSNTSTSAQTIWKQKVNGRLYFNYDITLAGEQCIGVWAVGKNADGHWAVSVDHVHRNETITTGDTITGYYLFSEYMFVSYIDASDGFKVKMSKTDDQANYSALSTFNSIGFATYSTGDTKKLLGVTAMYEPLPSGASAALDYRKNRASGWTEVLTDDEDGSMSHAAINLEADGTNFGEHELVEFKLISNGGTAFTGFSFKEDYIANGPY